MPSTDLIQAIAVTAELCGRTFSPEAARVFVDDLSAYPEPQLLNSLRRCRREVRGLLTVQDVVSRIDDGRPGAEEAWAMLPKSEADTAVWTDEMAEASRVAQPLITQGDMVAARMAFRECYTRLVGAARDAGRSVQWRPSLGHDQRGREAALLDAVEHGRISAQHAQSLLPSPAESSANVLQIVGNAVKRIEGGRP